MRISERQRYRITNTRIEKSRAQNASMLEKISTLKRINKISDDPVGVGKVLRYRDRIENINQYISNIEFSKGYLERAESALSGISDNLIRAKELAVGMSNGVYGADSRESTARELKQIMKEVVGLANSTFANRYVFSGFRTKTPSVSEDGEFLGDDGALFLQIDDGDFRRINVNARYLFEATPEERQGQHANMMDSLNSLYIGFTENNVDIIRNSMDELEHQLQKTTSFQASLGSLYKALEAGAKKLESDSVMTKKEKAEVEEVDMFKASSDFHRTESILQSTLLASNKMLQPSLLNFMQ